MIRASALTVAAVAGGIVVASFFADDSAAREVAAHASLAGALALAAAGLATVWRAVGDELARLGRGVILTAVTAAAAAQAVEAIGAFGSSLENLGGAVAAIAAVAVVAAGLMLTPSLTRVSRSTA